MIYPSLRKLNEGEFGGAGAASVSFNAADITAAILKEGTPNASASARLDYYFYKPKTDNKEEFINDINLQVSNFKEFAIEIFKMDGEAWEGLETVIDDFVSTMENLY